jgi:protein SCO1/2
MIRRLVAAVCTVFLIALLVMPPRVAQAHDGVPHGTDIFSLVRFDQHLDAKIPAGLEFRDENDRPVALQNYLTGKPVILALSYFECSTLCPLVRQGLVESLRPLAFTVGEQFDVVLVSIDPAENAATAQSVKQETVNEYGRAGSDKGWHFLRGNHDSIDKLADAIGFRYAYDSEHDEYAHPSGIVLLTPEGHIARYFFGIEYASNDVRLGLVEASQNQIGTAIDQLLLLCYHYDPSTGKYSLLIMNVVRLAGALTVVLMGGLIFFLRRKEVGRGSEPELRPKLSSSQSSARSQTETDKESQQAAMLG